MKLTVVGSGDAFGSGGRLQTCFHVATAGEEFLIDCGATSLIGMQRLGLDPQRVSSIFISHLHGDHFSGLVWWMIHSHHVTRRTHPLTITGPAGIEERFVTAAEALFPVQPKLSAASSCASSNTRKERQSKSVPFALRLTRSAIHQGRHPMLYALRQAVRS